MPLRHCYRLPRSKLYSSLLNHKPGIKFQNTLNNIIRSEEKTRRS